MLKVSVIIPCYNVENYIDKCLASVINQTYKDFEIILIDDGSTDNTLNKCIEWKNKDRRIVLVSKKNEGLGETRNLGISMAKSEYVTFLDADDWWDSDYIFKMIQGSQKGKNDLVVCDINIVYKTKICEENKISKIRLPYGNIDIKKEKYLLSKARTQAWGKLYKKSLFIKNNIKEPMHAYEDVATTPYIVAKANSVFHVNKPMYFYFKNREGSIINRFSFIDDLLLSLEEVTELFKRDNLFDEYKYELRRILWGELCFLYRMLDTKFKDNDMEKKLELCKKCDKIVYETFPELQFIAKQRFFAINENIRNGLSNIIPEKKQILNDLQKADFAILFKSESLQSDFKGKIIYLNDIDKDIDDKEQIIWDLADRIYDKLIN